MHLCETTTNNQRQSLIFFLVPLIIALCFQVLIWVPGICKVLVTIPKVFVHLLSRTLNIEASLGSFRQSTVDSTSAYKATGRGSALLVLLREERRCRASTASMRRFVQAWASLARKREAINCKLHKGTSLEAEKSNKTGRHRRTPLGTG